MTRAKLAKEKGFDWPTNKHYQISLTEKVHPEDGKSGPFGWEKDELSLQDGYFINGWEKCDISNSNWFLCAAPTQSLLQKWLREKHKLHIMFMTNTKNKFYLQVVELNGIGHCGTIYDSNDIFYDTYEEALEQGLQQALNLI